MHATTPRSGCQTRQCPAAPMRHLWINHTGAGDLHDVCNIMPSPTRACGQVREREDGFHNDAVGERPSGSSRTAAHRGRDAPALSERLRGRLDGYRSSLFCHVGKGAQEFRPLAMRATSTADVHLAGISRHASDLTTQCHPEMTEEGHIAFQGTLAALKCRRTGIQADGTSANTISDSCKPVSHLREDASIPDVRRLSASVPPIHHARLGITPI